jgi:hypothetical protein
LRNFPQDNQPQDVPVGNHRGQLRHHRTVRQVIEESGDVGVEYVIVPLPPEFEHLFDRLMTTSARPEAVRVVVKPSLEDRTQEATNHFLSDPITHSRDSQRPKLAGTFGNVDPPCGQRLERPCFEFPHQPVEVLIQVRLEHLNRDLIDPRGPAVSSHGAPGVVHERRGDPPREAVDLLHFRHRFLLLSCGIVELGDALAAAIGVS